MTSYATSRGTLVRRMLGGRSNVFLVSKDGRHVLADTSTRAHWRKLTERLNALSIGPGELSALVLTHAHFDHAGSAAMIRETYKAGIIISEREKDLLESGTNAPLDGALPLARFLYRNIAKRFGLLDRMPYEPCRCDIAVRDRYGLEGLGLGAYLLLTPGHTSGSMSLIVDGEIAIAGDALFGVFPGSVLPPWAIDKDELVRSWKLLLDTGCRLFLPSHGRPRDRETLLKQYKKYSARLV